MMIMVPTNKVGKEQQDAQSRCCEWVRKEEEEDIF